ncbi:unnamed protein product [Penicillium camemberti]|nr:unnamed protein product [Penicillium camemberti]
MEKWNAMSEAEREKRYRIALANYDHYKEERLNKGDVEKKQERQDPSNNQWQDGDEGQNGYCASIIWFGSLIDVPAGAQPSLLPRT